ncbi:hypothetical protein Tco_1001334 [Tanacetum coccineum]
MTAAGSGSDEMGDEDDDDGGVGLMMVVAHNRVVAVTLVARWRRGGEVRLWDGDGVKVLVKVAAVVVMCDGCWPESGRDLGRKNGGGARINGEREGACVIFDEKKLGYS